MKAAEQSRWTDDDSKFVKEVFANYSVLIFLNKVDIAHKEQKEGLKNSIAKASLPNVKGINGICITHKLQLIIHFASLGVFEVSSNPREGIAKCPVHGEDVSVNKKHQTWKCDSCDNKGNVDCSPQGLQDPIDKTTECLPEMTR